MSRTLALFDFDGTLTKKDTFIQFAFFAKGSTAFFAFVLFSPLIFLFKIGILDSGKVKLKLFSFLFRSCPKSVLDKLALDFIDRVFEKELRKDTMNSLSEFKSEGAEICIVSASIDIWIKPFAERIGVQYLCTEADYEDGIFKGNYRTKNCNKEEKAKRIVNRFDLKTFKSIVAYGNSSADKPMLALADQAFMV